MRKLLLVSLAISLLVTLGCLPVSGKTLLGSGNLETKEYEFTNFDSLEISSAFDVEVRQGNSYQVSITVDDNLMNHLDVRQSGSTVKIGLKSGFNLGGNNTLKAEIVMPTLESLVLSGASRGNISGFETDTKLNIDVSGASNITGYISTSRDARIKASGASKVILEGKADGLDVQASGASSLQLGDFAVNSADIELSGASKAEINASDKLSYEISGASHLSYSGDPTLGRHEASGASSATRD